MAEAGGENSTAWGTNTRASAKQATAWGSRATASGHTSTAWGWLTEASARRATAWGNASVASGAASTAWGGYYYHPDEDPEAEIYHKGGTASGIASTAFGMETTASGDGATAWGGWYDGSTAWKGGTASGKGSTAFGVETTANTEGSTAWGYQTTAGKETIDGTEYSGTYATAFGQGSKAIGLASTAFGYHTTASGYNATAFGMFTTASGHNATAFGQGSKAIGLASTAFGFKSEAEGKNSTAFGDSSKAEAENSLAALGGIVETAAENSAAIGKGATVKVAGTVALGSGSVASRVAGATDAYLKTDSDTGNAWVSTHNAIAVGDDDTVTRQITGVAAGSKDTDAVNVAQLKKVAAGAVYTAGNGVDITDNKISVTADGKVESGNTGIVTGGTVYSEVRPADGTYVKAANTTAANLGALDKQVDQNTKDIKTNADGIKDLDGRVTQNENDIADLKANGSADMTAVNHRISNLDSKINKVGAGAAALAALHPLDTDNKFTMAAGFGNYRNANAMALGMFYRPTDQVMFSVGGSMGNGENMINAGVSFALDKGVTTSKAAMAKQITNLSEENKS
ncbi:MAG: YadA-like family protein, partial [Acidaminococcaceae bacterium]|nr:YadA-like family protein [Acidaminococcaceae bacterium]